MKKTFYTYDDIQLVPSYSEVKSRLDITLNTSLTENYQLVIPIVASPMDTVCGYDMAKRMYQLGGVGFIHRFYAVDEQVEIVKRLSDFIVQDNVNSNNIWRKNNIKVPIAAAVGVSDDDRRRTLKLVEVGANVILIDVAHGHHIKVKEMLIWMKSNLPKHVDVIAGNIATAEAARDLEEWGVDGLRVGIGGGCFTPDMKVNTSEGSKRIEDIQIGDQVYTHTGELKPVINKFDYEDYDEIYDIDGIETTYNHKFYVIHQSKVDLATDKNYHDYAEWVSADKLNDEYFLIELD